MHWKEIIKFIILRTIGNFLVLFTVFGFFATFGPAIYYEIYYRAATTIGVRYQIGEVAASTVEDEEGGGLFAALVTGNKERVLKPKNNQFSLVIPKIGANANVIENVDPTSEKEYLDALYKGVAHAKGSAFPGMNGNIYFFSHSTDTWWNVGRYNALFYLLKELQKGDDVVVFYEGGRYNYEVFESKITDPSEVQYLQANIGKGETLILQTCWPPGTTWKRLLVFARPT